MHLGTTRSRILWIYPWQAFHQASASKVIGNWTLPPTTGSVTDVMSFLGLSGFSQRFVADYATVAAPLTDSMQKGEEWVWLPVQQHAFETLKARLLQAHVLIHPDNQALHAAHGCVRCWCWSHTFTVGRGMVIQTGSLLITEIE